MNILATLKQALAEMQRANETSVREVGVGLIDINSIADLSAAIEQMKKAEPVAWRFPAGQHYTYGQHDQNAPRPDAEPLYTYHPDAQAEIERLKKRFEIDDEAAGWDGIACRDETIKLQDEKIERLTKERDSFHMDYRMKCDAETKELRQQLAAKDTDLRARTLQLADVLLELRRLQAKQGTP